MKYYLLDNVNSHLASYLQVLGVNFECIVKNDKCEDYVAKIVKVIGFNTHATLIANSYMTFANDKEINYKGIELLKWLRISELLLNPIIVVGLESLSFLLKKKPQDYILLAPSTYYLELPITKEKWNRIELESIESVDKLKESYKPFVQADFHTLDISHSLANDFGMYLMKKGLSQLGIKAYDLGLWPLMFAKAEFIHDYKITNYTKELNKANSKKHQYAKGFNGNVVYLDDQGLNGWFDIVQSTLGTSEEKFIPISPVFEDGIVRIKETVKLVLDKSPSVILIDLRLAGDKEADLNIDEMSGSKIIKQIRSRNHSIPIFLITASDRIKTLEVLGGFPYFVDSVWTKPRVDKKGLNVSFLISELTEKFTNLLKDIETSKLVREARYMLEKSRNDRSFIELSDEFDVVDYFIFDTCYLQHEIQGLITLDRIIRKYPRKVVIVADVWAELELNSRTVKEPEIRRYLIYILEQLKSFLNENKLIDSYRTERYVQYSELDISFEEIHNGFSIYRVRKLLHSFTYSRQEKDLIISNLSKELKQNSIKSLIHADDIFRLLIGKYIKDSKKVAFFSNDLGCKNNIYRELKRISQSVTLRGLDNSSMKKVERGTFRESSIVKNRDSSICYLIQENNLPI